MKMIHAALLSLFVSACGAPPAEEAPAETPAVEAPVARGPNAFDVALTLTPRAAEKLTGMGEQVTVDAMFFGDPKPGALGPDNEDPYVEMGSEQVNVPPANAVVFVAGESYDPTREGDIDGGKQVLVNVYSARKAHEDNLLNCGIYQGAVSLAQKKPVEIQCDLIE